MGDGKVLVAGAVLLAVEVLAGDVLEALGPVHDLGGLHGAGVAGVAVPHAHQLLGTLHLLI